MYKIRHSNKRGGSGIITVPTNERAKTELLKLFKQRLTARIEKNGIVIGEVYKIDARWNWYLDTDA